MPHGDKYIEQLMQMHNNFMDEFDYKSTKPELVVEIMPEERYESNRFPSILPTAIRVAARTIGQDLVAVQPMQGPTGKLFYLDYKYEANNEPAQEGRHIIGAIDPSWVSTVDIIK